MWKISNHFSAGGLIGGLLTAGTGSAFLYLEAAGLSNPAAETLLALIFLLRLLRGSAGEWFYTGLFLGLFWFGWIGVSFLHYGHPWAVPLVSFAVALIYAAIFWLMAHTAERLGKKLSSLFHLRPSLIAATAKALWLWLWSLIHPFGFDWFKPELVLVHSYFGVDALTFGWVLAGVLFLYIAFYEERGGSRPLWLLAGGLLLIISVDTRKARILSSDPNGEILLETVHMPVEQKWRPENRERQIREVLGRIDRAVARGKRAVILPESVLPLFLNRSPKLLEALRDRSWHIDIVLGALYLTPDRQNRNSAYLFHEGNYTVADKVVLVPFGEANPLPDWAGRWLNKIFFDGAPDYTPASKATEFHFAGKSFRAAVCYEGTSERLYRDRPRRIVMLSNNGWFYPSIEPVLQRLLLEFYHRKYGTEIWHAVNMGESYIVTE